MPGVDSEGLPNENIWRPLRTQRNSRLSGRELNAIPVCWAALCGLLGQSLSGCASGATSNPPVRPAVQATTQGDEKLIEEGVGVGSVRLGMTKAQVVAALGLPQGWSFMDETAWSHPNAGMGTLFNTDGRVFIIACGWTCGRDTPFCKARPFKGHFQNGVRLGDSSDVVRARFGPPERVGKIEGAKNDCIWVYPQRGVEFSFSDGTLYNVRVMKPYALKVLKPASRPTDR